MRFNKGKHWFPNTKRIEIKVCDSVLYLDGCQDLDATYIHIMPDHTIEKYEIKDIECIHKNENLEKLQIGYTDIGDLSFIEKYSNLKELIVPCCEIADISALKNLSLEVLWLFNNNIEDISCLNEFKNPEKMKAVSLLNNPVQDFSYLENMINLKKIHMGIEKSEDVNDVMSISDNTFIYDSGYRVLSKLKQIRELNDREDIKDILYEWKLSKIIQEL